MMWISKAKYNRIIDRLDALEEATYCPAGHPDSKIGRILKMVLDHLGLSIERPLPYDRLVKKGGPERPENG
jgi:hypothetical protein